MCDITLSKAEKNARNEYYKEWRKENPEKTKAARLRYWENKAAKIYGTKYTGPEDGEEMSAQAREIQRRYYAENRKKNPNRVKSVQKEFWSRKAEENIKERNLKT